MKRLALLAVGVLLAGCAAPKAGFEVKVPVPVYCQEAEPDRPVMPTEQLAPGGSLDLFVKSAQAEIEIRDGYEGQLLAALRNCKKAPTSS